MRIKIHSCNIGSFTTYILLLLVPEIYAQNLVPNPSFELYNDCPDPASPVGAPGANTNVTGWYKASAGSTDYFNACANTVPTGISYGVPVNFPGYQQARTGNAYMGGHLFKYVPSSSTEYREYMQAELINQLVAGHEYYVSFWVSFSNRYTGYVTDHLGAVFSPFLVNAGGSGVLPFTPQVENPPGRYLDDTLNWMQISGTFTAAGDESFILIGNFRYARDQNYKTIGTMESGYYYVDDVCVFDLTGNTSSSDTLICAPQFLLPLSGDGSFEKWHWSTGDTSLRLEVSSAGTYWVRSFSDCGWRTDTFRIRHTPVPAFSLGRDTSVCDGSPVSLYAPEIAGVSWRWENGGQEAVRRISETGTYGIKLFYGECTAADEKTVQIRDFRQDLGSDTIICAEPEIPLLLEARVPEQARVLWSTGSMESTVDIQHAGIYWVRVNDFICNYTDTIQVFSEMCSCGISLPNAFTPNGDGKNDVYRALPEPGCPVSHFTLRIWNRFGETVFESNDPGTGWDGRFNGRPAEPGTYFYHIRAQPGTARQWYTGSGDLSLIR